LNNNRFKNNSSNKQVSKERRGASNNGGTAIVRTRNADEQKNFDKNPQLSEKNMKKYDTK